MFRHRLIFPVSALGLALALVVAPAWGQDAPGLRFEEAVQAWDQGRFIDAMETLEDLLTPPDGSGLTREIALLTGELHPVTEVAPDGGAVRWSPDGRYLAYEEGRGPAAMTHVLAARDLTPVAAAPGFGLTFSPVRARAAYLQVAESEALAAGRERLREEYGGGDWRSRMLLRRALAELETRFTRITVLDLATGRTEELDTEGVAVRELLYGPEGDLYFVGVDEEAAGRTQLFLVSHGGTLVPVVTSRGAMEEPMMAAGGTVVVYGEDEGMTVLSEAGSRRRTTLEGDSPVLSGDGSTLAFLSRGPEGDRVSVVDLAVPSPAGWAPRVVAELPFPVSSSSSRSCTACPRRGGMALSHDGTLLAVQGMPREDWEIFLVSTGSSSGGEENAPRRLTREIQHDLYPVFLPDGRLLAMKGEGRHRRSHLYDLEMGEVTWLFRNNTLRTVAPEYEWAPSPDGSRLLLVAERDGNTVSPERGVYLMDLTREVSREEVLARIRDNLAAERDLRARAEAMYGPLKAEIRGVLDRVSMSRIFRDEEALFQFGSKFITRPGNRMAMDYLVRELEEAGYGPELQWFEARGVETANVIARIPGTVSPEVVYAVSAHFDSNSRSPGADDNNSATVGLLEMARVLKGHPLPATVEIAFFTGEEAGLLGSREYVRRAVESGKVLVGALNNDMVGFAEDHRLDNTIRYSNEGIRDLQHGAAILFSEMVLHDAEYYKSTDAAAYYDAYGDIVGGIGSYPILANPHYHQSHDVLETVNHRLVTEVAKVTIASAMLLASSPSRIRGLEVERDGPRIIASWEPAVEEDVTGYRVVWGPEGGPPEGMVMVEEPRAILRDVRQDRVISVKAVNERGMEGWDRARAPAGG